MKLEPKDIQFDPASYVDSNGRLFRFNGEIYRAISPAIAPTYCELIQNKQLDILFEKGLIETEISDLTLDGYGAVLKHRQLPFISFGFEWCTAMLKDAALLVLDFSLELAKLNLELQDANPWNVIFEGCRPKYVDFGSIVPIQSSQSWLPQEEFIKCFLNPLYLIDLGYRKQASKLMQDYKKWGVTDRDMFSILRGHHLPLWLVRNLPIEFATKKERIQTLVTFREFIENIPVRLPSTEWSEYYQNEARLDEPNSWNLKQSQVADIVLKLQPKSLLDIGSNSGWYSQLAARNGSQVVAFDVDETCINNLYKSCDYQTDILPLVIDFCHPTPAHGKNLEFASATQRLKCEMVLALAVVHHLVFKQSETFENITSKLAGFTNKWLLIEFIPKEDRYVSEWYNDNFSWYTNDNFVRALQQHFSKITTFPSNRLPRTLLLCEK
jgi:hypothetical protein